MKQDLPIEMSKARQNLNNGPVKTMIAEASNSEGVLLITNNRTAEPNVHIDEPENNIVTVNQNDLPVEMAIGIQEVSNSGEPLVDANTTPENPAVEEPKSNLAPTNQNELPVETNNSDDTDYRPDNRNELTAAATGLIMLGSEGTDPLLEKYDNSKILPINTAQQVDFGQDPNTDVATMKLNEMETWPKNNNITVSTDEYDKTNSSYDSDNTILLEKEISEAIGDQTSEMEADRLSTPDYALPGETADQSDTNTITDHLANVRINTQTNGANIELPVETANTPVSPSRGKVVIRSYRLRHAAPNDTETTKTTTEQDNTENEVLYLNVPSGNATRPPPPNKYKIRKFQIDKVRYYSCTYCNKHFESIHYLNNHHKKHHPPVSCDVCGKLYDTPNCLIRHSYRHLDGQFKCKDCDQSFHFKSELNSHSMKHSTEWLHCKQCDKSFVRNSDLNAHIATHGEKWKCTFPGCNKECANKRYLNTHMKVHSAELKYPCRKCKKCFRFYEQRKWHEADYP